jgi:hypothetical protein
MRRKRFTIELFALCLAWLVAAGTTVLAAPVEVLNPSFESPILTPGGFIIGAFDGWETTATAGVLYPVETYFNLPVPDGNQVGFANYDVGQLAQTLSATLQSNTTYTLTVYVGKRLDCCNPSTYSVELYAGTELLGSESSQDPAAGDFAVSTVTFTSGDPDPLEGLPLQIVFKSTTQGQVAFDNVSLDATPVP